MIARKFTIALLATTGLSFAGAAHAADVYVPPPAEPVYEPAPAAWSWSGVYFGGQVGYGASNRDIGCPLDPDNFDLHPIDPLNPTVAQNPFDYSPYLDDFNCDEPTFDFSQSHENGFVWGLHFGVDHQFGQLVIGAVIDANRANIGRSAAFSFDPDSLTTTGAPFPTVNGIDLGPGAYSLFPIVLGGAGAPVDYNDESNEPGAPYQEFTLNETVDWYGTARARAGIAPGAGRFLLFGTGGFAFGQISQSGTQRIVYTPDEADRVFDTLAPHVNAGDGEYFPGFEADALPSGCANGPGADPDGGGPLGLQTSVECNASWSGTQAAVGYSLGVGGEFLVTPNFSLTAQYLYVNLGVVPFFNSPLANRFDFQTVTVGASLRFN